MKRILLAALAGGAAMFLWGALSHMVLGLEKYGFLPETSVGHLQGALKETGFYVFPGEEPREGMTAAEKEAMEERAMERWERGPRGVVVYNTSGGSMGRSMLLELLSNVVAAFFAAILLAFAAGNLRSYGMRVWFVGLLGLVASLSIDFSNWNWWGFPTDYAVGASIDQIVGWTIVGLVLAAIVRPAERPVPGGI